MTFFSPRPDPAPAADDAYLMAPWLLPEDARPGLGAPGVTLARTETTALQLMLEAAHQQGLALILRARFHPKGGQTERDEEPRISGLRIGMEWSDGTRVEADPMWEPQFGGFMFQQYHLISGSLGGGDLTYDWGFWLRPVPPAEPVTVHVMWPERGIPETASVVDLGPIVSRVDPDVERGP